MVSHHRHNARDIYKCFKEGDVSAFEKIYALYSRQVLNFAFSFSICMEDAEEVVQDTFVRLWDKRSCIDEHRSVEAFMFTIAKNLVIDKIRKIAVDQQQIRRYWVQREPLIEESIDDKVNGEELNSIIADIILTLPPKRRRIFELNRFHHLTYRQIAELLKVSPGTVEKQMNAALKTIKAKLVSYDIVVSLILAFTTTILFSA